MQKLIAQFIPVYTRWVINKRWLVIIACLLVTLAAGYGLRNFAFTADYKVYFSKDNAEIIAFEKFENTYTNTENILFVLQPQDKNVFTRETLAIVKQLTKKAWQIPHVIRVDSVSSYKLNVDLGILTVIAVSIALVMDFLLLPPMLMFLDREKIKHRVSL